MKKFLLLSAFICSMMPAWALTSITTKNIAGSPFCGGTTIIVKFTIDAAANAGNVFTAQLSDKNGSFASPVNIGSVTSTVAANISCVIPNGTVSGTKYKVRVVASNPAVIGSEITGKLSINPAPTNIHVTTTTGCSATLAWDAVSTATFYKVRYKLSASSTWSTPVSVGLALSYNFTGLNAGSAYKFSVNAYCASGNNSGYKSINGTTAGCPAPTNLFQTAIGITTADLTWSFTCSPTDYTLQYKDASCGTCGWTTYPTNPTTNSIHMTGLAPATTYDAQIKANCPGGSSAYATFPMVFNTEYKIGSPMAAASASLLTVFPNPSEGNFTIEFNSDVENVPVEISVENIFGQSVYHRTTTSVSGLNSEKISLENQSKGFYMVNVKAGDNVFTKSVLVN